MVWEDIEEDEGELLRDADYDARARFYRASSRSLTFYVIVSLMVIALVGVAWIILLTQT